MDHSKRIFDNQQQSHQQISSTFNQIEANQPNNCSLTYQEIYCNQDNSSSSNEYSSLNQSCANTNISNNSCNLTAMSSSNQLNNNNKKSPMGEWSPSYYLRASSPHERKIDPAKEAIMLATSQIINLCDVPLKRQIYESLMRDQNGEQKINFQEFMRIDQSPTFFPLEEQRINEVKRACNFLRCSYEKIVSETAHLEDAVQVTEAAICRLIKMSNQLASFNRLNQDDRIALLKHAIIEMFCIRATTNFNSENNFWYFIDDKKKGLHLVSMDVLKAAQINYLSHKEFAIKFNSQFRNDTMIADLLTVIILFRPSRANVSNPSAISDEFLNYCYLLRRYLQVKYNGETCMAKNSFLTLMYRLEELHPLAEDVVRIYLDLNPQNAGQLFVELFDLKK